MTEQHTNRPLEDGTKSSVLLAVVGRTAGIVPALLLVIIGFSLNPHRYGMWYLMMAILVAIWICSLMIGRLKATILIVATITATFLIVAKTTVNSMLAQSGSPERPIPTEIPWPF